MFFALKELSPAVKNILLLNSDGTRVAVKYYSDDWPTNTAKLAFEKLVFNKTQKTNARSEGIFCEQFLLLMCTLFRKWFLGIKIKTYFTNC